MRRDLRESDQAEDNPVHVSIPMRKVLEGIGVEVGKDSPGTYDATVTNKSHPLRISKNF